MANIGEVAADVPGVLSTTIPAMAPAFWIRLACYTRLYWLPNEYLTPLSILLKHPITMQKGPMADVISAVITCAVNTDIACVCFSSNQTSVIHQHSETGHNDH
jgi:hypothetical protein